MKSLQIQAFLAPPVHPEIILAKVIAPGFEGNSALGGIALTQKFIKKELARRRAFDIFTTPLRP